MADTNCGRVIAKKYNLAQEDADQLVAEISQRATSFRDGDVRVTIKKLTKIMTAEQKFFAKQKKLAAKKNILKERSINYLVDKMGKLTPKSNLQKLFKKMNIRDEGWLDANLKAFIAGSTHERFGGLDSIAGRQLAKFKQNYTDVFRNVSKTMGMKNKALMKWIQDERNVEDIVTELFGPNGEGFSLENPVQRTQNQTAFEFARGYVQAKRNLVDEANSEGAAIGWLEDHVTTQYHDPTLIRKMSRDDWSKLMLDDYVNHERTFGAGVSEEEKLKFMKHVYDNILDGKRRVVDDAPIMKSSQALATRMAQHRKLHFKTSDRWLAYQREFGHGDIKTALINGLKNLSDEVVLIQRLGTNPDLMMEKLIKRAKKVHNRAQVDFDEAGIRSRYMQVTGESYHVDSSYAKAPSIARITHNVKTLNNMSSLGGATIASFSDLASVIQTAAYNGMNIFESIHNHFGNVLRRYDQKELNEVLSYLGEGFDDVIGGFHARFSSDDFVAGRLSNMQDTFFRLNFLQQWTTSHRNAFSLMLSSHLAKQIGKRYDQLDEVMQRAMRQYGIEEADWNTIQRAGIKEVKGPKGEKRTYVTPDTLDELAASSPLAERAGIKDLALRMRTYFAEEARTAVPEPGANQRAFMYGGSKRGTGWRTTLDLFWQFRSFGLTYVMKMFPRYQQMGKGFTMANMVAMTMLGYISLSIKDIIQGKKPRPVDPTDPSFIKTTTAALVYSGTGGVFADFIMNDFGKFGVTVGQVVGGRTMATAQDIARAGSALVTKGDAASETFNAIIRNAPYANLFWARTALNYAFLYNIQEAFNPGYLKRMERRVQKEYGQEFIREPIDMKPTTSPLRKATWPAFEPIQDLMR
jgi:hypothetical protein